MKRLLSFSMLLLSSFNLFSQAGGNTAYVNPFVGTGGHGHTFPGATVPFGMVQLSPDTRVDGSWDGCSGYHYSDSVIYGFSHTHLSGTGCSDYGDIMLMPEAGALDYKQENYASSFSHTSESASPGYYKVFLKKPAVQVELTATTRVGMHRYTTTKQTDLHMILDLNHRDKLLEGKVEVINSTTVMIFRRSEAWAKDQYIYARLEFSKPFAWEKNPDGEQYSFDFKLKKGEQLLLKVALSTVGNDGATKNMERELPAWDFDAIRKAATALWNTELAKIDVKTGSETDRVNFYTALYHTMIQPNVAMDVDGFYRGRDNRIHKAEGFTYYSVFSLWDTFRAAHPLYTIIDRKRSLDFIKTFLAQYKDGGRLPVWELSCNETDCMIGYHSVSVITDAAVKGITDFDMDLALEAMKKSATGNKFGLPAYADHGVLTVEDEHESVSKTLEYAYDDWCIGQFAKLLNNQDDYLNYDRRSQYWKNVFDPATGFMRPRKNGGWLAPFEPREVNNNFTEGNSWQYSFFVPQDVPGLIEKMGGPEAFDKKLDELFSSSTATTGRDQADITGLIGQYAQGNEPSHHMAYLYDYIGRAYKTQERVKQILTTLYKPVTDGLSGNEDCGQMSAWYVLSSMGFYQVCPGTDQFMFGYPLFDEVTIHMENGNDFRIIRNKPDAKADYIQNIVKNGKELNASFRYSDMMSGASLEVNMGDKPVIPKEYIHPASMESKNNFVENPVIISSAKVFAEKVEIQIQHVDKNAKLYYTTDGSKPTVNSAVYSKSFELTSTAVVKAIAVNENGIESFVSQGKFYQLPNNWKVSLASSYNPQYSAGGAVGLIDGIHGDANWRKGDWQGYQSQDFECILDLGKVQTVNQVSAEFLQDVPSWIVFPKELQLSFSSDSIHFADAVTVPNSYPVNTTETSIQKMTTISSLGVAARYIKIKAINYGKLPDWHPGKGGDAFIFIDEIEVK